MADLGRRIGVEVDLERSEKGAVGVERVEAAVAERDQNVLHTGVMAGSNQEIAARLRAEYPDDASEFALGFAVDLTTGVRVPFGTRVEPGTPVVRVTWVPQLR